MVPDSLAEADTAGATTRPRIVRRIAVASSRSRDPERMSRRESWPYTSGRSIRLPYVTRAVVSKSPVPALPPGPLTAASRDRPCPGSATALVTEPGPAQSRAVPFLHRYEPLTR